MAKQKPLIKKVQHHIKEFNQSAVKIVLEEQLEANEVESRKSNRNTTCYA